MAMPNKTRIMAVLLTALVTTSPSALLAQDATLAIDGDPLEYPGDLRHVLHVVKDGVQIR